MLVKHVPPDIFVWIFDTFEDNFENENDFTDIFVLTYDTFDQKLKNENDFLMITLKMRMIPPDVFLKLTFLEITYRKFLVACG